MKFSQRFLPLCAAIFLWSPLLRADQDDVEGPWGTVHADLGGTAAMRGVLYGLGEGPIEEKWRLDIVGAGHDRPGGRSSITFDKEGNLYWISSSGGGTGGVVRLVSASPAGDLRWAGNDGAGNIHALGSLFSGASPVVGGARVYALGDGGGTLALAAYDKSTGANLWTTDLSPSTVSQGLILTPALYRGKLYAVGLDGIMSRGVHQVDAESGIVDWSAVVAEVGISAVGQMAFVPDAFGEGVHGLYFNGDSNSGTDGVAEVYGIRLEDRDATLGWMSEGGKAARSHVIYSESAGLLYTLTWSDYGAQVYVFDPATGYVGKYQNTINTGHGFYDVGALDFDGGSIIAGGFDGNILRYVEQGGGNLTEELLVKGGTTFKVPYWGETRVLGQLVQDASGNSILITGTNSFQCCASHIVAVDVTQKKILWEHDTGIRSDHQFIYAGGPLSGPDGKVYYFERPSDGSTALVALGVAGALTPPTAGFIAVDGAGAAVGSAPGGGDPCIKGGEKARLDASCSTGKDVTWSFTVDPPEGAAVSSSPSLPIAAEIRFDRSGTFNVTLELTNSAGSGACTRSVCVVTQMPRCALVVTDEMGKAIDDVDDGDAIPCLPASGKAIADASGSIGGDLDFAFSVTPAAGVQIDQAGGASTPRAAISFASPGNYLIALTVSNDAGQSRCSAKKICVIAAAPSERFLRGDCNSDKAVDLSDAVTHLGSLFLGDPAPPCLEACDSNGDGRSDVSDPVYLLDGLFLAGPPPPAPYPLCGPPPAPGPLGCGASTC